MTLPIALDAMGGDFAPKEIIAGARNAVDELGLSVILVGVPDQLGDTLGLEVFPCTEVIAMDDDPAASVRKKKDSSLVRAAELVRDGRACAMVSAGNTGAAMASALLRMGRLPGVVRPCIATPIPNPDHTPMVLVDAGANSECTPEMLVQFALMASTFVTARYNVDHPRVGLLSIGEESTKGTPLVKETHQLLAALEGLNFVGNVEGRDLLAGGVHVIVTDGFTGNVALKTLEGALRVFMDILLQVFASTPENKSAGDVLLPALLKRAEPLDPENTGGAMLLGLKGVCIISHGSSTSRAIVNAVLAGHDLAGGDLSGKLAAAVAQGS